MAQTIKLKRSATSGNAPSTSDLALGEVAINTYDGKVFIKKNDGSDSIVQVNPLDVDLTSVADGDRLAYNSSTKNWENVSNDMSELNNDMWEVTSTAPTDGSGKPAGYVWYVV